jgi:hypothetical protein
MPLNQILNRSSLRFFAGISNTSDRQPLWEPDEYKSKPLFSAGCVGEISVRWNYFLEKWIMLYNCELCNTSGIIVRLSDRPWGPWSAPKIVFDPSDGYEKFMHEPGKDNNYDYGRDGPNDRGDEYGPYQIAPYSTGIEGRYTKIYFTMSTWNPYQVVQMSAIITSMIVAFSKLSYDYHNNISFKDNLEQTKHSRWALDAIHSGHTDWLISQINRAADYEHFLLPFNDCLCYAYGPHDSNEFKYARLNVLLSNLSIK